MRAHEATAVSTVSLLESCRFWPHLGLVSFGGPAGQIQLLQRELVERRRWISEGLTLHHPLLVGIALGAFHGLSLLRLPYPLIGGAALVGLARLLILRLSVAAG